MQKGARRLPKNKHLIIGSFRILNAGENHQIKGCDLHFLFLLRKYKSNVSLFCLSAHVAMSV